MTAVRSSTIGAAASGTAMSAALPAGTIDGDVVIVIAHLNANGSISDNNGARAFTEDLAEFQDAGGSQCVSVFSRRLVSGDAAALGGTGLLFTGSSSTRWGEVAVTFSTPHPSTIYDVAPTGFFQVAADDFNAPQITTLTDNAIHCIACCPDGDSTPFTGFTPDDTGYTRDQAGGDQAIYLGHKVITPAGLTASNNRFTFGAPFAAILASFAIKDSISGVDSLLGQACL